MGKCFSNSVVKIMCCAPLLDLTTARTIDLSLVSSEHNCSTANATRSDICILHCDDPLMAYRGITFDCGHAGLCIFECEELRCAYGGGLDASNVAYDLTVNGKARQCFRDFIVNVTNDGNAYFNTMQETPFYDVIINAGTNTNKMIVNCTWDASPGSECVGVQINAQTAQYLQVNVGSGSEFMGDEKKSQQSEINCPENSSYNGSEIAPCIVDISQGGTLDFIRIWAKDGMPKDLWIKESGGIMQQVIIACALGSSENNGENLSLETCWQPPTTINPTQGPSKRPTVSPSYHPTRIPPTPFPTPPGTLQCGMTYVGTTDNDPHMFVVHMPYEGDLLFDALSSDSELYRREPIEVFTASNEFVNSDSDRDGRLELTDIAAGNYHFMENSKEDGIRYDVTIVCVSRNPTSAPTQIPTPAPTIKRTLAPTSNPVPAAAPTQAPSKQPTTASSNAPTPAPSNHPTFTPTTQNPAQNSDPTPAPSDNPTRIPTNNPTHAPTSNPAPVQASNPTETPTQVPTNNPAGAETNEPTSSPNNAAPTSVPRTQNPLNPSNNPSVSPTDSPTGSPLQPTPPPTITHTGDLNKVSTSYTVCIDPCNDRDESKECSFQQQAIQQSASNAFEGDPNIVLIVTSSTVTGDKVCVELSVITDENEVLSEDELEDEIEDMLQDEYQNVDVDAEMQDTRNVITGSSVEIGTVAWILIALVVFLCCVIICGGFGVFVYTKHWKQKNIIRHQQEKLELAMRALPDSASPQTNAPHNILEARDDEMELDVNEVEMDGLRDEGMEEVALPATTAAAGYHKQDHEDESVDMKQRLERQMDDEYGSDDDIVAAVNETGGHRDGDDDIIASINQTAQGGDDMEVVNAINETDGNTNAEQVDEDVINEINKTRF